MSLQEYAREKPEIHHKISTTPMLLNEINSITDRIQNANIKDPKLKNKANEKVKIVEQTIITKNKELSKLMNEIVDKESILLNKGGEASLR